MSDPLTGLTALIAGASSGIGLATAEAMAVRGVRVGMVARRRDVLEREAERIGAEAFPADVTAMNEVEGLRTAWDKRVGGAPDILVNAAGTFTISPFADTTSEEFDRNIASNLRGPFLVLRAFLPGMRARGSGHIVNVGSIAGRLAFPGNGAYSASKFGLRGMHEVLAAELTGTRIRMSLIDPAATDSPLWDPLDPDGRDDLPARASMLQVGDVARAVLYVVSQPDGVEISHLAIRSIR